MPALVKIIPSKLRHKVTLRLSPDAFSTAQEAVELGISPNQNAFIEDSIRLRAREVRHARMRAQAEEAMNDPGFVADMRDTMEAFKHADTEFWPIAYPADSPEK